MTMEPIRLTVTARDGQPRSEWPLTRGVTLPEGAVSETGELMLAGPEGAVPVQLRPPGRAGRTALSSGCWPTSRPASTAAGPPSTTFRPVGRRQPLRTRRWR